ncbi:stage V sporulation protein AC [Firmicutes bacterium i23-0019-B6]
MTPLEKQIKEKQYQDYVKQHTPVHNVWTNMLKAFLTGGSICTLGQLISNYCKTLGLSEKDCGAWTAIVLVLFSVILTGLNVYSKIANWGGAGALVPITGFANSVAAPAIEYKKEGQVFGIGAKIFTIAGPVLLYGVVTSWALGVVYWVACWVVAA